MSKAATGTLGKAMEVIDIISASDVPLRFTDILSVSDQPRGTLHRRLSDLVEEGLLTLGADHTYALGPRLLKLAARSWASNRFRTIAEPHLQRLQSETGETVHLGILNDIEVIYLDKVEGRQSVRMYSQIGNASPVYCTGVGKAALATLEDADLRARLDRMEFHRFTRHTLVTVEDMWAEIAEIRRTGVSYDREEHEEGIRCIAAPIRSANGSVTAGVSVTGPAFRVTQDKLEGWAELVRRTAAAVEEDMAARLGPRA